MSESEDQALEQYLRRSSPLSRAYRELGQERPSPALDQAVIAAARSAMAERGSQRRRVPWRWPAITALAATVVLSFALVMRLALEPAQRQPANQSELGAAREERAQVRDSNLTQGQTRDDLAKQADAPSAPAAAAPTSTSNLRGLAATPAPGKAARATRSTDKRTVAGASAPQQLSDSEEAKLQSTLAVPTAAKVGSANEAVVRPAEPAAGPALGTANSGLSPAPASEALKKSNVKPPEQWLEEIAHLRESGEIEAAEREYAEFKRAYPDYVRARVPAR